MTELAQAVMAVVHVQAPAQVDPHVIEAELVRAINTYRKRPMSAEFTLAPDHRTRPAVGRRRRHGFIGILSFAACPPLADLQRRVQKRARKAPSTPLRPTGLGRGRHRNNHRRDQCLLVGRPRHPTSLALNRHWSSGGADPASRASPLPRHIPIASRPAVAVIAASSYTVLQRAAITPERAHPRLRCMRR